MRFEHKITFEEFGLRLGAGSYGDFKGTAHLIGEDDEYLAFDKVASIELETREYVDGEFVEHEIVLTADHDDQNARILFALLSGAMLKDDWFQSEFADALLAFRQEKAA